MKFVLDDYLVCQAYRFVRASHPFRSLELPPAELLTFGVTKSKGYYGAYSPHNGLLDVSSRHVGHWHTLISTVAHEAIHVHQFYVGAAKTVETAHNAYFKRVARQVCAAFGFDPKTF
jgi:hypothetical protein